MTDGYMRISREAYRAFLSVSNPARLVFMDIEERASKAMYAYSESARKFGFYKVVKPRWVR